MSPADVLKRSRELRARLARDNFAAFCEYAMTGEGGTTPLLLSDMHRSWCELVQREDRVCISAFAESGKTSLLSIAFVVWSLGRDVNTRACIISATHTNAAKIMRAVAGHIRDNPRVRDVFPGLKPGNPWRDDALVVAGRAHGIKEPSCFAVGNTTGSIIGARVSLLVLDDCETWESTRTQVLREATRSWVDSSVLSRLVAKGKCICVATPWTPSDLLYNLAARPGWSFQRFPVVGDDGMPTWPAAWPASRIEEKRASTPAFDYARSYLCMPIDDESAMFPSDALAQAIARGERLPASAYIAQLPVGASVYIGCDMAFATGIKNDQSSLCGIMVRGDGTRIVMFSDAGRWGSEETMRRVQVAQQQFAGAQVTTECNGPQQMVVEQLRKRGVNVSGYATGGGQRSLLYLAELASSEFSKGQYVIPSVGGQPASAGLAALVGDLGAFVRNASHVPDRVSAYLLASYAARRGEQRVTFFDTARTGFSLSR